MPFRKIAKWNLFKNDLSKNSNQPPWSNSKVMIEEDLPAGKYSMGVYKWDDTGNLSLNLSVFEPDENLEQTITNPKNEEEDLIDDFK